MSENPGNSEHAEVAKRAAAVAAQMVSSNPNLEGFKRVVVRDTAVQDRLAATTSEEDFVHTSVELAAQHGYPFTADDARSHLRDMQRLHPAAMALSAEVPSGPTPGGGGSSSGAGCGSQGTISNPSYSLQCGLNTQKCLCTL